MAKYEKYLVIGDLNAETEEPIMREFCDSYNLKNLIKEPTCFKNPSNPSCIDLMLTNSNRSFQNSLNIETGLSDFHKMTVTVLKTTFPKVKPKIILYRNYIKFSNYDFREEIIPLVDKLDFGEVDKTFESFQRICINTLDKHSPKKHRHVRANQSPFMNNKLNKAIMNRSRLRNRFLKNKTEENKKAYNRQRNYVVSLLKKSKHEYYNNLNTKDIIDNKKNWTTGKPLFSDKISSSNKIILIENGNILSEQRDGAEVLNNALSNILTDLNIAQYNDPTINLEGIDNPILEAIEKYKNHPSYSIKGSF